HDEREKRAPKERLLHEKEPPARPKERLDPPTMAIRDRRAREPQKSGRGEDRFGREHSDAKARREEDQPCHDQEAEGPRDREAAIGKRGAGREDERERRDPEELHEERPNQQRNPLREAAAWKERGPRSGGADAREVIGRNLEPDGRAARPPRRQA